jgi:hypothetical protein
MIVEFIEHLQNVITIYYNALPYSRTHLHTTPKTKTSQPAMSSTVVAW